MDDFLPSHSGIQWNGFVGVAQYSSGQNVVLFYNKPVHNPAKSTAEGRPVYEDKVYVRIQGPGDRFTVIDRPATQAEMQRYPVQWAQFQQNKQQTAPGTPIEMLYPDTPSIPATLRASGVQTIEQCAELSGPSIDAIGMGAQQYSNDAKRYLEMASKGMHHAQVKKELEERDSKIRVLEQQVLMLKGQLDKFISSNQNTPTLEQLHAILQGMSQRPAFPPAGMAPTQQFDAQAAQIAAVHPSNDMVQEVRRRGRPRKTG